MMITVGFVSPEGFLVAASEETLAQALSTLSEQTGVDVKEAYSLARGWLQFRYGDGSGAQLPDDSLPGSGVGGRETGELAAADSDAKGNVQADKGGTEVLRPAQERAPERAPSGGVPCTVCGGDTPPALADMAKERFGAVLCRNCGNW